MALTVLILDLLGCHVCDLITIFTRLYPVGNIKRNALYGQLPSKALGVVASKIPTQCPIAYRPWSRALVKGHALGFFEDHLILSAGGVHFEILPDYMGVWIKSQ